MSEQDTGAPGAENEPVDNTEKTEDDKTKDFVSKKEWDALATKYRRLGKELESKDTALQELTEKVNKLSAEPSEDATLELKQSFQKELAKLEEQRDSWKTKFNKVALEGKVKEAAAAQVIDVDDFWLYANSRVQLVETEDGKFEPEVKNSVSSLSKFIDDYCAAKPHNARTKKVSGSGVPSQGDNKNRANGKVTLADLAQMSKADRVKALIDDPELLKEASKSL